MWNLVIGALSSAFGSWQAGRTRKQELEDAKHERRVEVVKQGNINEATWNIKSIEESGWAKDWMTLLLSLPLILTFFDKYRPAIEDGFKALESMPTWYTGGVSLMIASAFGFQQYHRWQMNKHYTLPGKENTESKI